MNSMYLTHTFASSETRSRAHSWLTALGFHPRHAASGIPRIMIIDDLNRLAEARVVINAVESADRRGFPGFWDQPTQPHAAPEAHDYDRFFESRRPHTSAIGWHPLD
jgi:hypothetical protein